jgi:hypothetical protein
MVREVESRGVRVDERRFRCHSQKMKRRAWLRVVAGLVMVCGVVAAAQDKGYWRADNSTAKSITGDIALSDEKMAINLVNFPVSRIRGLEKDEAGALFDADGGAAGSASLYRLSIPSSRTFVRDGGYAVDGDLCVWPLVTRCVFFGTETAGVYCGCDCEFYGSVREIWLREVTVSRLEA